MKLGRPKMSREEKDARLKSVKLGKLKSEFATYMNGRGAMEAGILRTLGELCERHTQMAIADLFGISNQSMEQLMSGKVKVENLRKYLEKAEKRQKEL